MPVEARPFGPDSTPVSLLGFGCGAVGGLMVRGAAADQERAVARALEAGINYFDTAVQYGDGASERHLGSILRKLGANEALVGTEVRLHPAELERIAATVAASLDGSLHRLQRDHVDVFHLHNAITTAGGGGSLSVRQVLEEVAPALVPSGLAPIHLVAEADLATGSVLCSGMGRNAVCRVRFEGGDRAA